MTPRWNDDLKDEIRGAVIVVCALGILIGVPAYAAWAL